MDLWPEKSPPGFLEASGKRGVEFIISPMMQPALLRFVPFVSGKGSHPHNGLSSVHIQSDHFRLDICSNPKLPDVHRKVILGRSKKELRRSVPRREWMSTWSRSGTATRTLRPPGNEPMSFFIVHWLSIYFYILHIIYILLYIYIYSYIYYSVYIIF